MGERQSDGGLAFNGIEARGGGLLAQGRVRLSRDNRVIERNVEGLLQMAGNSWWKRICQSR